MYHNIQYKKYRKSYKCFRFPRNPLKSINFTESLIIYLLLNRNKGDTSENEKPLKRLKIENATRIIYYFCTQESNKYPNKFTNLQKSLKLFLFLQKKNQIN